MGHKFKHKKKEGMSRGRRQREARRARKAAEAEKTQRKEVHDDRMQKQKGQKAVEAAEKRAMVRKRQKRFEPDTGPMTKKARPQRPGELADDFELRAMERFRMGKR